jgi:hypothetical protein
VVSHVTVVLWLRALTHCAVSFSFFFSPRTHLNVNKLHSQGLLRAYSHPFTRYINLVSIITGASCSSLHEP